MSEENLFIAASGFELEAAVFVPPGGPSGGAVICHPHPQYGGDMHNNVVSGVQRALAESGLATLRFNFRGVGRSGGSPAGPDGDQEDVALVVEHFRDIKEVDSDRVAIVGYSYGAMVGLAAGMIDPRIPALVAISPPIAAFRMEFISRIDHPLLTVSGDKDMFCPIKKLRSILPKGAILEIVDEADHLYWGFEGEAGQRVASFLKSKLGRS